MSANDWVRGEVDAIIADIARIRAQSPNAAEFCQAEDREAFEIVRRIERRLMGLERPPAVAEQAAE